MQKLVNKYLSTFALGGISLLTLCGLYNLIEGSISEIFSLLFMVVFACVIGWFIKGVKSGEMFKVDEED